MDDWRAQIKRRNSTRLLPPTEPHSRPRKSNKAVEAQSVYNYSKDIYLLYIPKTQIDEKAKIA